MRKFIINVNDKSYEVEVEEVGEVASTAPKKQAPPAQAPKAQSAPAPTAKASQAPAPAPPASEGGEVVDSPMPGNIWKILVKEGQEVKEGEVLLILEAMKMENEITSPKDGVVASILTQEGAAVNTGDKLVVID